METWKDIDGYIGHYQVSDAGNIRSLKREKIKHLKCGWSGGYRVALLFLNNKRKYVYLHRLIAISFLDNPKNEPQVNHKNGIKSDNSVTNLEWISASKNCEHAFRELGRKVIRGKDHVKSKVVIQISLDGFIQNVFDSITEASSAMGVTGTAINRCLSGKSKTSRGFIWRT